MKLLLLFSIVLLLHCGGGNSSSNSYEGAVSLTVEKVERSAFLPSQDISEFRVSISAKDMAQPITAFFPAEVESGVIENIPIGKERVVTVEAFNRRGQIIRAAEAFNVTISGGKTAQVHLILDAVPFFVNLADHGKVDNTRLVFEVASDPGEAVVVENRTAEEPLPLLDPSTSQDTLLLNLSTGVEKFRPTLMTPGDYIFAVRSLKSHRETEVRLTLLDGSRRKAASLFPAGSTDAVVDWKRTQP